MIQEQLRCTSLCMKSTFFIFFVLMSVLFLGYSGFLYEQNVSPFSLLMKWGHNVSIVHEKYYNDTLYNDTKYAIQIMAKSDSSNVTQSLVCLGPSSLDKTRLRSELKDMGFEPAEDHEFKSQYIITPKVCLPPSSVPDYVTKGNTRTKVISCFNCPAWFNDSKLNHHNRDFRSCEYSNCHFDVTGKFQSTADVLVFFVGYLGNTPVPSRPVGQIWVKAFWESPVHYTYPVPYDRWKNVFNWTFTYRTDSDIFAPSTLLAWRHHSLLLTDAQYLELARNKTKMAAWFVSNCDTPSQREQYVQVLQKYIEVDIYGKCGNLSCPRSAGSDCESLLGKSYKFYLSFENSLCLDYVTEKVFQRLATRSHVIPVVRGGFNYTKYLPSGWFVNAADFPNARELAVYLKGLGNDPQKYAAMLKEKDKLVTLGYKNDYCDFCEKLHTDQRTKIISDIKEWSHKATCYSPIDVT
ncbi:alpha-(1,3)-fucosyltransferase C-like isoform X1 [Biomphalaria glabrata]|uniref:Fucosyltransferase n=1 Tax=Biomphalaria glabrata TaxID=6526 RepID=A0A9U8E496_BIOGL|nr:alpha-(1,3)-fucosyltransferase C-like isoform X1 [Biomphalaria glabrata]XP_013072107.2 alpha-(1,3)-fucosyltransferase C-like isoform X1 [Biomphalaria glabrata]XP_013072112.2 alpha-(1,3)-fucosyltransferase C-like isoform X1 [Biomphalaria glabrata]XP_013072113.2 alpha-(1,3)-fucosyltransferase C-like isoform X1 [Biomphalaria glabrata]XP_055880068.1 alpha-(1,3)-fucosyltransferase C-like isoform X1 [Biomphalaria glabrata]XP_055880070.1 alpha-(1,3)-fucosyltransferase C-like isoform X1 [Biomphalar